MPPFILSVLLTQVCIASCFRLEVEGDRSISHQGLALATRHDPEPAHSGAPVSPASPPSPQPTLAQSSELEIPDETVGSSLRTENAEAAFVAASALENAAQAKERAQVSAPDHAAIRKQIEYYLSDENLRYDQFFHQKISDEPDGWLEVKYILTCNKLKHMGAMPEDVLAALKGSKLEVQEGGSFVRRPGNAALPKLESRQQYQKKSLFGSALTGKVSGAASVVASAGKDVLPVLERAQLSAPDRASVRKQVEYYLSDENLRYDSFLHQKVFEAPDGWLEIKYILSCNKIRHMGATLEDVLEALKQSTLEVNEGASLVRRPGNAALPKLECKEQHHRAHDYDGGIISVFNNVSAEQNWSKLKDALAAVLPGKASFWFISKVDDKQRCFCATAPFEGDVEFFENLTLDVGGVQLKPELCQGDMLQVGLKLLPKQIREQREKETLKRQEKRTGPLTGGTQRFLNVGALRGRLKEVMNSQSNCDHLKPDGFGFNSIKAAHIEKARAQASASPVRFATTSLAAPYLLPRDRSPGSSHSHHDSEDLEFEPSSWRWEKGEFAGGVLDRVRRAIYDQVALTRQAVEHTESSWARGEVAKRVVKYIYTSATQQELGSMDFEEACDWLVEYAMGSYEAAFGDKEWFFKVDLAPAFAGAAWELFRNRQGINFERVKAKTRAAFESYLDSAMLNKGIWVASGNTFKDVAIHKKVYAAVQKSHKPAFEATIDEIVPADGLERVQNFLQRWINDSMARAWNSVPDAEKVLTISSVSKLFQNILNPFGPEDPFSTIPSVFTEGIGPPPRNWAFVNQQVKSLFESWELDMRREEDQQVERGQKMPAKTTRNMKDGLESIMLNNSIWEASSNTFKDATIHSKVYIAVQNAYRPAFNAIMMDMRPGQELERVQDFLKHWISDSMTRAWNSVPDAERVLTVANVSRLFQNMLAPFGPYAPSSTIPSIFRERMGPLSRNWALVNNEVEALFNTWTQDVATKRKRTTTIQGSKRAPALSLGDSATLSIGDSAVLKVKFGRWKGNHSVKILSKEDDGLKVRHDEDGYECVIKWKDIDSGKLAFVKVSKSKVSFKRFHEARVKTVTQDIRDEPIGTIRVGEFAHGALEKVDDETDVGENVADTAAEEKATAQKEAADKAAEEKAAAALEAVANKPIGDKSPGEKGAAKNAATKGATAKKPGDFENGAKEKPLAPKDALTRVRARSAAGEASDAKKAGAKKVAAKTTPEKALAKPQGEKVVVERAADEKAAEEKAAKGKAAAQNAAVKKVAAEMVAAGKDAGNRRSAKRGAAEETAAKEAEKMLAEEMAPRQKARTADPEKPAEESASARTKAKKATPEMAAEPRGEKAAAKRAAAKKGTARKKTVATEVADKHAEENAAVEKAVEERAFEDEAKIGITVAGKLGKERGPAEKTSAEKAANEKGAAQKAAKKTLAERVAVKTKVAAPT